MADGPVRIPLLPNPNARRWYAGTCLVTLAVLGYLVITEPANLPWLGPAVAVLVAPVLLVWGDRDRMVTHRGAEPSIAVPMRAEQLREQIRAMVREARGLAGRRG